MCPTHGFEDVNEAIAAIYSQLRGLLKYRIWHLSFGKLTFDESEECLQEIFLRFINAVRNKQVSLRSENENTIEEIVNGVRPWILGVTRLVMFEFHRKVRRNFVSLENIDETQLGKTNEARETSLDLPSTLRECSDEEAALAELLIADFKIKEIVDLLMISRSSYYRLKKNLQQRLLLRAGPIRLKHTKDLLALSAAGHSTPELDPHEV